MGIFKYYILTFIIINFLCSCTIKAPTLGAYGINAFVEGSVWEMDGYLEDKPNIYIASKYFIDSTQTLNGKEYLNVYYTSNAKDIEKGVLLRIDNQPTYCGCVRSEGGKIYFVPPGYEREGLIFDFNIKPTDEVEIYPDLNCSNIQYVPKRYRCVSTEEFIIGDSVARLIKVTDWDDTANFCINEWIGGIGTGVGPLESIYACMGGGSDLSIKRVIIRGKVIYDVHHNDENK